MKNDDVDEKPDFVSPAQCRARRGLLETFDRNFARARIGSAFDRCANSTAACPPRPDNMQAMGGALQGARRRCIPENGGGPGVRLKGSR